MAKYERRLQGDFSQVLGVAHDSIMQSMSATLEDGSDESFLDTLARSLVER